MVKIAEDTPMIKQYFEVKAQNPEAILLYRVGDFYETYSDDAILASRVLGLVQTKRSNGDKGAIPMAGFPHHALETYLPKLIRAGYKVAVCDQLEDPRLTGRKLVKRGVTELVTPGIALGEAMLEQKENNFLAGVSFDKNTCGVAFLDVSTGSFKVSEGSREYIATLLSSMHPKEVLVTRGCEKVFRSIFGDNWYISTVDEWAFVYDSAIERIRKQLKADSLKGYAVDAYPLGLCAAGALLVYLEQTHHSGLGNICSISRIDEGRFVWMDRFTVRNLEIFQSAAGSDGVSLVQVVDRCVSPMGARLLRSWLAMPSIDLKEIEARYNVVTHFHDNPADLDAIQDNISEVGDMERIVSRAAAGKISPREVLQLSRGLGRTEPIKAIGKDNADVRRLTSKLSGSAALRKKIDATILPDTAAALGKVR